MRVSLHDEQLQLVCCQRDPSVTLAWIMIDQAGGKISQSQWAIHFAHSSLCISQLLSPAGFKETQKGDYKIASVCPSVCASMHACMHPSVCPSVVRPSVHLDFAEAISLQRLH